MLQHAHSGSSCALDRLACQIWDPHATPLKIQRKRTLCEHLDQNYQFVTDLYIPRLEENKTFWVDLTKCFQRSDGVKLFYAIIGCFDADGA